MWSESQLKQKYKARNIKLEVETTTLWKEKYIKWQPIPVTYLNSAKGVRAVFFPFYYVYYLFYLFSYSFVVFWFVIVAVVLAVVVCLLIFFWRIIFASVYSEMTSYGNFELFFMSPCVDTVFQFADNF